MQQTKKRIDKVKDSVVDNFFEIFSIITSGEAVASDTRIADNKTNVNKNLSKNNIFLAKKNPCNVIALQGCAFI